MFKLKFYVVIQCVFSFAHRLSVCGGCAWVRVGAFAHQQSLCRLNYKLIVWYPLRVLAALYLVTLFLCVCFFCIAIYSNCYFSLLFCWFPCFVICFCSSTHYQYLYKPIDRHMISSWKKIRCQRDFNISPSLCADILISLARFVRRNYYFYYCCCV